MLDLTLSHFSLFSLLYGSLAFATIFVVQSAVSGLGMAIRQRFCGGRA